MRFVKLYAGLFLILLAAVILIVIFEPFQICPIADREVYNTVVLCCAGLVVLGVIISFVGGKWADKIGGE